ncbi:MAG: N-acetylmuramoyl-L-alanine amidase [Proteobacteria bacterium]|nr:N-acetylmuramoyl-L-alanine amidase [Pseudomonadota bacterium]
MRQPRPPLSRVGADSPLVTQVAATPNHDARRQRRRPRFIVLHYTGMRSAQAALARLCDPRAQVSAHYLVCEDGAVVQLVAERRRAWHAGVACWDGEHDVNSLSIGIEIANPGHDFGYPKFPGAQIDAVSALCADIARRHRIAPWNVLAHSDVAPTRKQDPGEKFPWRRLAAAGIGLWLPPSLLRRGPALRRGERGVGVRILQADFARWGYAIRVNGRFDALTQAVVMAFQRRYRPARIDGVADGSTRATLTRLLALRQA